MGCTRMKILHLSTWFIVLITGALGILSSGYVYKDITDDRDFGCRWLTGGTLNCTCDFKVKEFYIKEEVFPSLNLVNFRIAGCMSVKFGQYSIQNMRNLRQIELIDIDELNFEEFSLYWGGYVQNNQHWADFYQTPTLKISIESSVINKIESYTFKGRISKIELKNVTIKHAANFAFSNLMQTEQILLDNVNILSIDPQALKKFDLNELSIKNSNFGIFPSRTFMEVNVHESLLIDNCRFKEIKSGAFTINRPKRFVLQNSKIDTLDGEGFKIRTSGDVLFRNNQVGTANPGMFLGLSSMAPTLRDLTVEDTNFDLAKASALRINTSSYTPHFNNIKLNTKCDCVGVDAFLSETYLQDLNCQEGNTHIPMKTYKNDYCTTKMGLSVTIIIICVCVAVLVLIVALLTFYFRKIYRSGQYGGKNDKNKQEEKVIMPEGKTYRETEIMYIVERADLLTTDL